MWIFTQIFSFFHSIELLKSEKREKLWDDLIYTIYSLRDFYPHQAWSTDVQTLLISCFLKCMNNPDSKLKEMVPEGTRSLLVLPILKARKPSTGETESTKGFVLLASGIDYAFTDKDKAWIAAIASKFSGSVLSSLSKNPWIICSIDCLSICYILWWFPHIHCIMYRELPQKAFVWYSNNWFFDFACTGMNKCCLLI